LGGLLGVGWGKACMSWLAVCFCTSCAFFNENSEVASLVCADELAPEEPEMLFALMFYSKGYRCNKCS